MLIFLTLSNTQPLWFGNCNKELFHHSTQQDAFKMAPKKLAVGFKYMNGRYAADMMFDTVSVAYSTSLTYLVAFLLVL